MFQSINGFKRIEISKYLMRVFTNKIIAGLMHFINANQ